MASMKAVRVHEYGGPEVLRYEDAPRPDPGLEEVLVEIHAAGVNPIDWKARAGFLKAFFPFPLPFVAGTALSGRVAAIGAGVEAWQEGDPVLGSSEFGRTGAYAEYAVTRPDLLARKPAALDDVTAAALPVSATAAWHALFGQGMIDPQPGWTILIHGAGGAVGSLAAQIAKSRGARVAGTASAADAGFLMEIGVDLVIDYAAEPFEDRVSDVDAVLDTVGGDMEARSWRVLKVGGVFATSAGQAGTPSPEAAPGIRAVTVRGERAAKRLGELAVAVAEGALTVRIGQVLPLSEARRAQEMAQSGGSKGKVVLQVKA